MQINPGLSITHVSESHIQLGSGFRALELTGVTRPVADFIHELRSGIIDGKELEVAKQCQVTEFDCHVLLTRLRPVLVSTPTPEFFVRSEDPDHRGSLARLRCVTPVFARGKLQGLAARDRQEFQTQRYGAALQIFGLGRTGTALTQILRDSGIGHLNVWDSSRVTSADTGTGLTDKDIGQVRSLAVATVSNPKYQRPAVHPTGWLKQPELATLATVQITLGAAHVETIDQAKRQRHPYLAVVIRDDEIDIGPWVLPQATACPLCLEDASSYAVRTQRAAALHNSRGGIETVAGAHLVAGLIATEVLAMVDSQDLRHQISKTKYGRVPGLQLNTFTRVHLANGWVQTFTIEPLPGCCIALHEPRIANTSVP
ncbi:hypothetical protein [Enteractinococcus coprophilus]|uniref:ThiF family protein n=1 Tax=Enteractinococcus coprophilus TaxID=1027633 RepID=A0A543A014_9MICC|nr:hypothetical protein [Enteractinococcus coprophilus]TQL65929.1 hypothetical protein FB556_2406 [Enteractinococcus coprophilus]